MARSDLLLNLIKAGNSGNKKLFDNTVNAIIAEEKSKQHHVLVEKIQDSISKERNSFGHTIAGNQAESEGLIVQVTPDKSYNDLFLSDGTRELVDEVVEEHFRVELLRSYNLEPRNRIILVGPPGNGKTSLAVAIADKIMVPAYTINYTSLIGSYLGQTTSRIAKVFDSIKQQRCVLFIDELETIAKERGDHHETGEIKRVVSTLLLEIDKLPSHVIVIGASNHPGLLDTAIWRRFPVKLKLLNPDLALIEKFLAYCFKDYFTMSDAKLGSMAKMLSGLSFSDIENFSLDVKRRIVLSESRGGYSKVIDKQLTRLKPNAHS
tara:strand:+ start:5588 stop:6550 length:963 start_codon:yes stop_codon:yes gene_type:complete